MEANEIIDQIEEIRRKNNNLWMSLLRLALHKAPTEAKAILAEITRNDRKVSDLTAKLSE